MVAISNAEQSKRWRRKYPEKVREQRRKYLDRKIIRKFKEDCNFQNKIKEKLRADFGRLTKLMYNDLLPKYCEICGETEDLHIHHKKYEYPILTKDLIRLCRRCHNLEHQRIIPTDITRERV
jgi:hypothetical protein